MDDDRPTPGSAGAGNPPRRPPSWSGHLDRTQQLPVVRPTRPDTETGAPRQQRAADDTEAPPLPRPTADARTGAPPRPRRPGDAPPPATPRIPAQTPPPRVPAPATAGRPTPRPRSTGADRPSHPVAADGPAQPAPRPRPASAPADPAPPTQVMPVQSPAGPTPSNPARSNPAPATPAPADPAPVGPGSDSPGPVNPSPATPDLNPPDPNAPDPNVSDPTTPDPNAPTAGTDRPSEPPPPASRSKPAPRPRLAAEAPDGAAGAAAAGSSGGGRGWVPWDDPEVPDDDERTLGRALRAAALSTFAPGSGHLLLGRRRTGAWILSGFVVALAAVLVVLTLIPRANLIGNMLSSRSLVIGAVVCLAAALAWIGVIIRSYQLGRPTGLDPGQRAVAALTVSCLCLLVAAPLAFGANLANSQRNLLETLFRGGDGGTPAAEAIAKPRLNILLVGSDAGPDRTGARTDTMMVASIDTRSGRTTLFGLPRNIGYARFPVGSAMYQEFPDGFHNRADPLSGDYLLNAVYAYGHQHPEVAPALPTADPGLNLLHQTISEMLGLRLDYYAEVNMAGFASIIDALGGITVDVGPERIAIGGITPSGRLVRPDGYIEPGVQLLDGAQALAFARSRTYSSDYARMGRQRCLLQNILTQKSPTDVLANFRGVAAATTNSVSTNIPQAVLPALATLAGVDTLTLESVSFDPDLPDPNGPNGRFNTGHPDFPYMRQVVRSAIERTPAPAGPPAVLPGPTSAATRTSASAAADDEPAAVLPPASAVPTSVAASCG